MCFFLTIGKDMIVTGSVMLPILDAVLGNEYCVLVQRLREFSWDFLVIGVTSLKENKLF